MRPPPPGRFCCAVPTTSPPGGNGNGSSKIAVGCPLCLQMLTDGLKQTDLDEKMKVRDVASLVRESLGI